MAFQDLLYRTEKAESGGRDYGKDGKILQGPMTKYGTAKGRMQVVDSTATDPGYGVSPAQDNSAGELARVGRDYLGALVRHYKGDEAKASAAYNWGPGNLDKAVAKHGANWLQSAPTETKNYLKETVGTDMAAPQEERDVFSPSGNFFLQKPAASADTKSEGASPSFKTNPFIPSQNFFANIPVTEVSQAPTPTPSQVAPKLKEDATEGEQVIDTLKTIGSAAWRGTVGSLDNIGHNVYRAVGMNSGASTEEVKQRDEELMAGAHQPTTKGGAERSAQIGEILNDTVAVPGRAVSWLAEKLGADESAAKAAGDLVPAMGAAFVSKAVAAAGRRSPGLIGIKDANKAMAEGGKAGYNAVTGVGGKISESATGKYFASQTSVEALAAKGGLWGFVAAPTRAAYDAMRGTRTFTEGMKAGTAAAFEDRVGAGLGKAMMKDAKAEFTSRTSGKKAAPQTMGEKVGEAAVPPKAAPEAFKPTPRAQGETMQAARSRVVAERDAFLTKNGMEPGLARHIIDYNSYVQAGGKMTKSAFTALQDAI